jgi:hypothetical protein
VVGDRVRLPRSPDCASTAQVGCEGVAEEAASVGLTVVYEADLSIYPVTCPEELPADVRAVWLPALR